MSSSSSSSSSDSGTRKRRFLLIGTALSTATFSLAAACHKEDRLPGNPKGVAYDAGPPALPANPKGSTYDNAVVPPTQLDASATSDEADSSATPKSSLQLRRTDAGAIIPRMPANPKGTHYDKGKPTF